MTDLKTLWGSLNQQEQLYATIAGILLVLLLLFLILFLPVSQKHDELVSKANQLNEDIIWMRNTSAVFKTSRFATTEGNKSRKLKETIQRLRHKPTMRITPASNGEMDVLVKFNKISGKALFAWLDTVHRDTAAIVISSDIRNQSNDGWLTASIRFTEPN